MLLYLGIDPGKTGGIAAIASDGRVVVVEPMPPTDTELLGLLRRIQATRRGPRARNVPAVHAIVERVAASPQMGVVSAFTFGRGFGGILMALAAVAIPFDLVVPVTWQTAMGCRTRGDKHVSKRRAEQLFPDQRITHAIADALLLAEYGRRLDRAAAPEVA